MTYFAQNYAGIKFARQANFLTWIWLPQLERAWNKGILDTNTWNFQSVKGR